MRAVEVKKQRYRLRRPVARPGLALAIVLAAVLLGSASRYAWWIFVDHRAAEVSSGQLFQSAEMPAEDLIAFVEEHGIRSVFDIRAPTEGNLEPRFERAILETLGVEYFNLGGDPLESPDLLDGFLRAAGDPASLPMLVHCHHGTGRSVLAAAVYRIEFESWSNERARKATKLLSFRGTFGPRGPKGKFLRSYRPRSAYLSAGSVSEHGERDAARLTP